MANETINLDWHGPYAVVNGANAPNVLATKPEVTRHPGVYLWTFPVGDEYWVYYIGKGEGASGVLGRAETEFRRKDEKHHYIPDPLKLFLGDRVTVYKPLDSDGTPDEIAWSANPALFKDCWEMFLQNVRVFVAPMHESKELIRFTEGALIWTIWDYEWDNWGNKGDNDYYYISCDKNGPKRPTAPYTITMSFPKKIRGLMEVNTFTKRRPGT